MHFILCLRIVLFFCFVFKNGFIFIIVFVGIRTRDKSEKIYLNLAPGRTYLLALIKKFFFLIFS